MRQLYLLILMAVIFFPATCLLSQTAPNPQSLPFSQDFSSLITSDSTYPAGFSGWKLSDPVTDASYSAANGTADKAMAKGTASSTAGSMYNYDGKIGFLSSGSGNFGLVLAINTTGSTNISVSYTAMTIRNPYNTPITSTTTNKRINRMALQYRIGTSGNFTTIDATVYENNTTTQNTSVTTPQNPVSITTTLPIGCDNQAVVQLRWVNKDSIGSGSRPSFAIDDIAISSAAITADITAPTISTLTPATGSTDILPTTGISVVFSENIVVGSGKIVLHNTTNSTQQEFAITAPEIRISGNTLQLLTALQANKSYHITIEAGAVTDQAGNTFAGLSNNSWNFSTGAQPTAFDFNDCSTALSGGFIQYSVSGAQLWACTSFGKTGNGVQINGYSGGAQTNEDWLISPGFDLSGFNYPILSFASRVRFAGSSLKLVVSTNYSGSGDPSLATWTPVNGRFAEPESDVWTISDQIALSAFKLSNVYVAFVYTSSPELNAARWTLDDFKIINSATPAAAGLDIRGHNMDFDYTANSSISDVRSFSVEGYNVSNPVTLSVPTGFELSLDQTNFTSSIQIEAADANTRNKVYVRFKPAAADQNYSGRLNAQIVGTDIAMQSIELSGTSLRTLKVVNWNIEWFGTSESGFGPSDKNIQQQNVHKILTSLHADVYAMIEVVNTTRFKNLADSLPGNYGYVVNDYGSYASDVTDVDYPTAQKLGFIYNKDVVKNLSTRGVLRTSSNSDASYNWASGRYPFLMEAEVNLNGATSLVNFIVVHAKANTGDKADKIKAYNRREAGAIELKDSLDAAFPNSRIIILGDFNDDFDKTITTEMAPETKSSYSSFLNDSSNYTALTLPLSLAGSSSTASYPDIIDHVIASNDISFAYVPNSAKVYRDVLSLVSSYANTTSDHFPIITKYDWRYFRKPEITVSNLNLVTNPANCFATATLVAPTVTGFNPTQSITNNAPSVFPVGATVVTWTVKDVHGNINNATQTITVVDQEVPTASVTDLSANADLNSCSAQLQIAQPSAIDNCGIASVSGVRNDGKALSDVYPVGTTTITWTVTDIHQNATRKIQTIQVADTQMPQIVSQSNFPLCQSDTKQYSIPTIVVSDNCGVATISYTITGATQRNGTGNNISGQFNTGISTVLLSVTDVHGNSSTRSLTVTVTAAPIAVINVVPSSFCNRLTLSANAGSYTHQWIYNNSVVGTHSQLSLDLPNPDGTYTLKITDASGCSSINKAEYVYQKQNLANSYTILAFEKVVLGSNNTVASGSVGVMNSKGIAYIDKSSTVSATGAFVKAPKILFNGSGTHIPNRVYGPATVALPAMQYNHSFTGHLSYTYVEKNKTATINGNYNVLIIGENANVTLNGAVFGIIKLEKGAQLKFTGPFVNIGILKAVGGSSRSYSYIRFNGHTSVRVSQQVSIGDRVLVNPDNHHVTFYMGDMRCDEERFQVKGNDIRIIANVYMPNGKLKVIGTTGNGWNNPGRTATISLTGFFIAEDVESEGGKIIWNHYNCDAILARVNSEEETAITGFINTEVDAEQKPEALNVVVMPNPSRNYFTLKISSSKNVPVQLRILDITGKSMENMSNLNANSTVQAGHRLLPGVYIAELTQGTERKTVQLIKIN